MLVEIKFFSLWVRFCILLIYDSIRHSFGEVELMSCCSGPDCCCYDVLIVRNALCHVKAPRRIWHFLVAGTVSIIHLFVALFRGILLIKLRYN